MERVGHEAEVVVQVQAQKKKDEIHQNWYFLLVLHHLLMESIRCVLKHVSID
jgi:hypothetical protein